MTRSETAKLWAERLRRFQQAQMTVAQFCADEGVSQPSFYSWKRKLQSPQTQNALTTARFMPVAFQAKPEQHRTPATHAKATIELPGGIRIRVEVPTENQPAPLGQVQP
tara:strand:+ start:176399 stop:176725 length:327 start_codon:yes stop_codon:yes gene_type:complete